MMTAKGTAAQQIALARAAQIARVNESPARLAERLAQVESEASRLRDEVKTLRAHIAALEDSGATIQHDAPEPRRERKPRRRPTRAQSPAVVQMIDGRPAISIQAAADRVGVSLATACRYVNSAHGRKPYWQACRPDGYHWFVFTDQPLTRK